MADQAGSERSGDEEYKQDFAVWVAEGQFAGGHTAQDGKGRLQYLGKQPFLHPLRG